MPFTRYLTPEELEEIRETVNNHLNGSNGSTPPPVSTESPKDKFQPGDGVEVAKPNDANHQREGHVRKKSGDGYQVIFEPGEKEAVYHEDNLRPTGRRIEKFPEEVK
jgi:hypothetical protein